MPKNTLKLVIDARPLARNTGGMTRYLAKILPQLIQCEEIDVTLYTDQKMHLAYAPHYKNINIRVVGNHKAAKLAWHLMVPTWLYKDRPDIFWSPRQHLPILTPKSVTTIVTIHDLVWKTYPKTIPFLQRLSEKIFMAPSVKKADRIISISESTQALLHKYCPCAINKSTIILHGLDIDTKQSINTKPRGNYILAVGTIEPRKNYINLIKGFEEYIKTGQKRLTIVGKKGWLYDDIISTYNNSPVKHLIDVFESVNDQQLNDLYSKAGALISPSLDEGYGLPALEATERGIPLLLSNIPVYKELYPHAFTFFEPEKPELIAQAIHSLDSYTKSYSVNLSNQSSWNQCADNHINCFTQTLTNKK